MTNEIPVCMPLREAQQQAKVTPSTGSLDYSIHCVQLHIPTRVTLPTVAMIRVTTAKGPLGVLTWTLRTS